MPWWVVGILAVGDGLGVLALFVAYLKGRQQLRLLTEQLSSGDHDSATSYQRPPVPPG